jgi:NADPH2:quinone reductase
MKAIQILETGGPEMLQLVDLPDPVPGPGEVLVRHQAIGVNFIDTYQRTGLYPVALPAVLGSEAAGVVEAVGEGVTRFKTGDRIGYPNSLGAYADMAVVKAERAISLPDSISSKTAAAILLKGMTAEFLARMWPLGPDDAVLVHAAAGGVGGILTQWLKHLGCTVIATVGSPEKAQIAKAHGCDHVIQYRHDDVAQRVRDVTGGAGVRVVYDSVGKDTFGPSLNSLGRRGLFVSFGNASGPVPPFEPMRLARAGSLWFTRPTLFDYIATTPELDAAAQSLFDMVASGAVKIEPGREWPLAEARQAHEALQGRETTGSNLLIP